MNSRVYLPFVFLSAIIVFFPLLSGQNILLNKDVAFLYLPGFDFIFQQGLTIHPHLWYSGILGGIPLFATQFGISFHPLYQLFINFLGPISAFNWTTLINIFAGIGCAYWLGTLLLRTALGAAVFASIYSFSQMNIEQAYYPSVTPFFYILPLTFILILKISQGRRWHTLLLVPLWATAWLIGHPQFALYTAAASLLFALFLDARKESFNIKRPNLTTTALCIVGMAAAIFIASPWILRSTLLIGFSARAEYRATAQLLLGAIGPLTLTRFIYPFFHIPVFNMACCGGAVPYVGTTALLLALASFTLSVPPTMKFFRWLFLVFFVTSLYIPPLVGILFHLPVLKLFLYPFRSLFISNFALALLAAFTLERLSEDTLPRWSDRIMRIGSYALGIAGISIIALGFALPHTRDIFETIAGRYLRLGAATETNPAQYHLVITKVFAEVVYQFSVTNPRFVASVIFMLAPAILLIVYRWRRWNRQKLAVGFGILILLGPPIIWSYQYGFGPSDTITKIPNTAAYIASVAGQEKFRILRMTKTQGQYEKDGYPLNDVRENYNLYMETAIPNGNIFSGLESMNGYENFMSRRHVTALAYLDDYPTNQKTLPDISAAMNVRYVVSSYDLPAPFKRVFTENLGHQTDVYVYENRKFLPRIRFADRVLFTATESEKGLFDELLATIGTGAVLIECPRTCAPGSHTPRDRVEILSSGNGYFQIRTSSLRANWLVISESYYPGWEATIDGTSVPISRANYLFGAIFVPPGEHDIEYRYQPPAITFPW